MMAKIRGVLIDLSGMQTYVYMYARVGRMEDSLRCACFAARAGTLHIEDTAIPGSIPALTKLLQHRDIRVRFGRFSASTFLFASLSL